MSAHKEYFEKAQQALSKDNYDYALKLLHTCLEQDPSFAEARDLAHRAFRKKHHNKSTSPIKRVATKTQLALMIPSIKKVSSENVYPLMEKIERIIAQDPFDTQALEILAQVAQQAQLTETALLTYQEILEIDKKNLVALKGLSKLYQNKNNLKKAREILFQAVRHYPQDNEILKTVRNLDALGTIEKGQWQGKQESTTSPPTTSEPSQTSAPSSDAPTKNPSQLIEDMKDQVKRNPSDLFLHYQLGELLHESGEIDAAISQLQKAVQHPRKGISALNLIGLCFQKKRMFDLAEAEFKKALEHPGISEEERKEFLYNLGKVLEEMGHKKQSFETYKKIYAIDITYRDVAQKVEQDYKNPDLS